MGSAEPGNSTRKTEAGDFVRPGGLRKTAQECAEWWKESARKRLDFVTISDQ